jgi:site-specific recombinase XerD
MDDSNISLFKPARSASWYIQFNDADGNRKQKSTKCSRRVDALKKLSEFQKFISKKPKKNSLSLSSFTVEYLRTLAGTHSKSTIRSYALSLKHFKRIIGDVRLNSITPRHWDIYKTARINEKRALSYKCNDQEAVAIALQRQNKVAVTTINIELRSIHAAMSTAARWELITKNPFLNLPLVSVPKRTPAFLTIQDAERLLEAIKENWFRDLVIFAINTGMRRGELLSLRWQDVNVEVGAARVTNTVDFTTKSGEQRIVSLNEAAISVLNRRQHSGKTDYIFTNNQGNPLTPDTVSHKFKRVIREAKLPEALHLHSLRHSFASLLVGSGTSLFTVSKLLGHSSTKTSEIYSHLLPHHLQKEVEKISIGIIKLANKNNIK